ncbi:MAG: hypothetical protein Q9216_001591 [Gyalolechia sp. 2 TL-2023]
MAGWMGPFLLLLFLVIKVTPWRFEPPEPFAPPFLAKHDPALGQVFKDLEATIQRAAKSDSSAWKTNITSFSISVTSASETLWTTSHTAPVLGNYVDSPHSNVTEHTYFRIASISKVFTVLAVLIQQQAKNCSLHDSITEYIPELLEGANTGGIGWKAITLGTLASQLSGIPRESKTAKVTSSTRSRIFNTVLRTLLTLAYLLLMTTIYLHAERIVLVPDHAREKVYPPIGLISLSDPR